MGERSGVTAEPRVGEALACVERLAGQLCDDSDGSEGFGEPILDDDAATDSDDPHSQLLSQHKGNGPDPAQAADDAGYPLRSCRCVYYCHLCSDQFCYLYFTSDRVWAKISNCEFILCVSQ